MLREIPHVKQIEGEPQRRWFTDDEFDLILWFEQQQWLGFQLTYNKTRDAHALTWQANGHFEHDQVDEGENRPGRYKSTPILVPNGKFADAALLAHFREASQALQVEEPALVELVCEQIQQFATR